MSDMHEGSLVEELAAAQIGDERRTRRLKQMVHAMQKAPSAGFPRVFTEAELEGAYRFFSNEEIEPEGILSGHWRATVERIQAHRGRVLMVHDTTKMQFAQEVEGLSALHGGKGERNGFLAHVSLAVQPGEERIPLGNLGLSTMVRPAPGKESARWFCQVQASEAQVQSTGKLVHVMDREADDYELMAQMQQEGCGFIVRSCHNRRLQGKAGLGEKLQDALQQLPQRLEREVQVSSRKAGLGPKSQKVHPPRACRRATLSVAACPVTLQRPHPQSKKRQRGMPPPDVAASLRLHVVHVWEPSPPPGQSPIDWTLFTSEPVDTPQALEWVVDAYRSRWVIEEFFKALKTGCAYEQRQLGSFHALKNCLAVLMPIAYQLLRLRAVARCPALRPATDVVSSLQLEVLRACGRRVLPSAPTAQQVLLAIAALGGHLARNGPPGWLTLLHGYHQLALMTYSWSRAHSLLSHRKCDQ